MRERGISFIRHRSLPSALVFLHQSSKDGTNCGSDSNKEDVERRRETKAELTASISHTTFQGVTAEIYGLHQHFDHDHFIYIYIYI